MDDPFLKKNHLYCFLYIQKFRIISKVQSTSGYMLVYVVKVQTKSNLTSLLFNHGETVRTTLLLFYHTNYGIP